MHVSLVVIKLQKLMVCVICAEWLAHENAVFDIAWVPGEPHMVMHCLYLETASSAEVFIVWDV